MTDYKQMKIDSVTQHHVHSYAVRTNRSDASALRALVESGWQQYMNAWSDSVSAPAPTESEKLAEKAEGGRATSVFLPNAVIAELQACAF
jgi:hypothetical protein